MLESKRIPSTIASTRLIPKGPLSVALVELTIGPLTRTTTV